MKFAYVMIIVSLAHVALPGASQTLNFCAKDVPLKDILKVIKCQTGLHFFYDANLLKNAKPGTVVWKNASLENALNDIFKNEPYSWIVEGKTVTIFKNRSRFTEAVSPGAVVILERVQLSKGEASVGRW